VFSAPPTVEAEPFAVLPESLYKTGAASEWVAGQPGSHVPHSGLEGPCFDPAGRLYCVDIPYGRIFHVSPEGVFSVLADYEGEPNGMKIDADGRFIVADFRNGLVELDPQSGNTRVLCHRYRVERFKAINDLTIVRSGDVYFTEQGLTGVHDPTGRVFRLRGNGQLDLLLDNVPSPNGLVLNRDESELYVAATRGNCIWRVPLLPDGTVAKVGIFIQMSGGSGPDGLALDAEGNLAVAHVGLGCVWLFSRFGEPLLRINTPTGRKATNIAYGGPEGRTLYITEQDGGAILTAEMPFPGAAPTPRLGLPRENVT